MSKIKKEILNSMSGLELNGDEKLAARFNFSEDFIGFRGHFPDNKILPGICQIHCVQIMYEQWKKEPVKLKEVVKAKYFLPAAPGEDLLCSCVNAKIDVNECTVKAKITRGPDKVSEFILVFSFDSLVTTS